MTALAFFIASAALFIASAWRLGRVVAPSADKQRAELQRRIREIHERNSGWRN